jgi:Raf kinase inhibitor-like YbhB/YbcL family protein
MSHVKTFFRTLSIAAIGCAIVVCSPGAFADAKQVPAKKSKILTLTVVATGFQQGGMIPSQFTPDGADVSPGLAWSPVPAATKSIAIFCEDPDAPNGTWCHWIAFNIPPKTRSLPGAIRQLVKLPDGSTQATNDFQKIGYSGPKPPKGETHRYYFHIYALSRPLMLTYSAMQKDFLKAIADNILANGYVMGKYKRQTTP